MDSAAAERSKLAEATRDRSHVDARRALNRDIRRLQNNCQRNHLPETFGSDSSAHCKFQHRIDKAEFVQLCTLLAGSCDELDAVT